MWIQNQNDRAINISDFDEIVVDRSNNKMVCLKCRTRGIQSMGQSNPAIAGILCENDQDVEKAINEMEELLEHIVSAIVSGKQGYSIPEEYRHQWTNLGLG